jgi:hypothetical protein
MKAVLQRGTRAARIGAACLAMCLAACLSAGLADPARAAPVIDSDNVDAIKGSKRVAIERFDVEFYTQLYGEGRSGRNTARMTAELQGISDETRQTITQQAYQDLLAALRQAGFELVEPAALAAQPLFQALDEKYGHASPYRVEDEKLLQGGMQISQIVAPAGMRAHFDSGIARGDLSQRIEAQNQGIGRQQGELAAALDATLLQVHVLASFGSVSATKNGGLRIFAGLGAKAAIEAKPLLLPEETQIQIVNRSGARTFGMSHRMGHSGAVVLKEPLVAATNIFEMRDTQSQGDKDKQTAGNFLSGLIGGGAERSGHSVVSASSEHAYRSTYQALIRDALDAMVASLAAAR